MGIANSAQPNVYKKIHKLKMESYLTFVCFYFKMKFLFEGLEMAAKLSCNRNIS